MIYQDTFFTNLSSSAHESAQTIVPWVMQLLKPTSVVDVGCGTGGWLWVFQKLGVEDILGVDGDWVPRAQLEISSERFHAADLSQPLQLNRQFDLALSLEVGEHLPPDSAREFVRSLVSLAPVVLFSAAAPEQGGIGHYNEQWPSYWIQHFAFFDYQVVDCVRGRFWMDEKVAPWYCQNAFFYVARQHRARYESLWQEEAEIGLKNASLIHPRQYFRKIEQLKDPHTHSIKRMVKTMPERLKHALINRISGRRS